MTVGKLVAHHVDKQLLVEVLGIISVCHVRLVAHGAVEMLHSLLFDNHSEVTLEAILAESVGTTRHSDGLRKEKNGSSSVSA